MSWPSVPKPLIHKSTRIGITESLQGKRLKTDAFGRFLVPMSGILTLVSGPTCAAWLEAEVRKQHSRLALQHPDKIAGAIR